MSKIKLVIPKGRMFNEVARLLSDCGILPEADENVYFPRVEDLEVEAKIMKPQNIAQLIELGSHDAGFIGHDWILETGCDVVELIDLKTDPVKIVAAVPSSADLNGLRQKRILVASEYENIARRFLDREGYDYLFIRSFGATEAFPPQDADMIIDNTATGNTLRNHDLKVIATILESSTRFVANRGALQDSFKRGKIEGLKMLLAAVLNARERVMLEMNVPPDKMEDIVRVLPCMRAPTVSPLYKDMGYAVKVAVKRNESLRLIPLLKSMGATDILEYEFKKVII
jgi:ATP phosphoribosyltransferase